MRACKMVCLCVALLACGAHAKNTYSAFSVGLALPMASSALTPTGGKHLDIGWDGAWTFFGLPFTRSENALSGIAFGGKINYSRWTRDSTLKELYMLGTQGIVRYYVPVKLKPFDLFAQLGGGMFIGEHGFTDPDTIPAGSPPPERLVTEGVKNFGVSFNIGADWDVIEVTPGITLVFTKGKPSAWLSISAAAKF